jgi:hypothetical protein
LLTEDPTDGVAQIRFAATVGANNSRNAFTLEAHFGTVAKRLKAL